MTKSRHILGARWRPDAAAIAIVREQFPFRKTAAIAAELGVKYHQVTRLAKRLGIKKDSAWLNGPDGGRLDGKRGMGTRFQPGLRPPNLGKKLGSDWGQATQFKRGHQPYNLAPIGALRICAAGYLQIKLTATGYPPRDWVMYHRHVWEQHHGPIPPKHAVRFRGGRMSLDPEQITVDALELVTKRQLMQENSVHSWGPEIAAAIRLRGVLTRQINRSKI